MNSTRSASDRKRDGWGQIWYLGYPDGHVRRITNDFHNYFHIGVAEESGTVVARQGDNVANIWVAPTEDTKDNKQITFDNDAGYLGIAWAPNSRIVYCSLVSNIMWIMDADGSHQRQLTVNAADKGATPSVTSECEAIEAGRRRMVPGYFSGQQMGGLHRFGFRWPRLMESFDRWW